MHRDTEILHAGYRPHGQPGPLIGGPQFSSTYALSGDPAPDSLAYGRFQNPTWEAWEAALGTLEGGHAIAFASGMAATMAVFGTALKPGDAVVLPSDGYFTTRSAGGAWLESIGIKVRVAPTAGNAQGGVLPGARLLFIETPSNPDLDVCDIRALVALARDAGADVVVDNTTATAYLQRPLELGATYSLASDTKALTGHSDVVLGHVATADPERAAALRTWRTQHGAIPGPMEVWLAHRALATLPVRLTQQCSTAAKLAKMLKGHKGVTRVRYPGLPDHPGHAIAKSQMDAFGCVLSFDLKTKERAEAFLCALTLVREMTSFGGVHSSAERRARWGGDAISEGFIRFSVGCENVTDLLQDVRNALEQTSSLEPSPVSSG
jgi:cystathionine gamma-lyase